MSLRDLALMYEETREFNGSAYVPGRVEEESPGSQGKLNSGPYVPPSRGRSPSVREWPGDAAGTAPSADVPPTGSRAPSSEGRRLNKAWLPEYTARQSASSTSHASTPTPTIAEPTSIKPPTINDFVTQLTKDMDPRSTDRKPGILDGPHLRGSLSQHGSGA